MISFSFEHDLHANAFATAARKDRRPPDRDQTQRSQLLRLNGRPSRALACRSMLLRTGPFNGECTGTPFLPPFGSISGKRELAFFGDAFERFGGALDPVLAVVPVGRKQTDHLIGSARGRPCNVAGGKVDDFSNVILVLQRPLHHAKKRPPPSVPLRQPIEKTRAV